MRRDFWMNESANHQLHTHFKSLQVDCVGCCCCRCAAVTTRLTKRTFMPNIFVTVVFVFVCARIWAAAHIKVASKWHHQTCYLDRSEWTTRLEKPIKFVIKYPKTYHFLSIHIWTQRIEREWWYWSYFSNGTKKKPQPKKIDVSHTACSPQQMHTSRTTWRRHFFSNQN